MGNERLCRQPVKSWASAIGLSDRTLHRVLQGQVVSLDTIDKIALLLNLTQAELLSGGLLQKEPTADISPPQPVTPAAPASVLNRWREVAAGITQQFQSGDLGKLFVDPPVAGTGEGGLAALKAHLLPRANPKAQATPRGAFLIGEFGTGKTSLLRQLHSDLAKAWLKNESRPFPLFLNLASLPDLPRAFAEVVELALKDTLGPNLPLPLEAGLAPQTVLLLDSLDEMATDEPVRRFSSFLEQVQEAAAKLSMPRFVIGCRKSFFDEIAGGFPAPRRIDIPENRLEPWGRGEIEQYMTRARAAGRLSDFHSRELAKLLEKEDFREVCGKPLACYLLLQIWKQDQHFTPKHYFEVFDKFLAQGLEDWANRAGVVCEPDKRALRHFLDRMVLQEMVKEDNIVPVPGERLVSGLKSLVRESQVVASLEQCLRQVQTRSLLERITVSSPGGAWAPGAAAPHYRLFHRQIAQYLIARNVLRAMKARRDHTHPEYCALVEDMCARNPIVYEQVSRDFIRPMEAALRCQQVVLDWLLEERAQAAPAQPGKSK